MLLTLATALVIATGRAAPSSAVVETRDDPPAMFRGAAALRTPEPTRSKRRHEVRRTAKVVPGRVIKRKPPGPVMAAPSYGRAGTGLYVGGLGYVNAPQRQPASGTVIAVAANLPNRTSTARFAASLRSLTAFYPDFLRLNEVSRHSVSSIEAMAPGYDAYRDPYADRGAGGGQSLNNLVMWSSSRWTLVDAGRVKLVENDMGYYEGHPFTWDRYAMWATLQRADGGIVSIVSVHMMTNPGRYPRQPRRSPISRVQRYAYGMDVLRSTVAVLGQYGPVLVGGDMNSHPQQGLWTAAAKLGASGYRYAKDNGVMYLFYPASGYLVSSRQVSVASDHPALVAHVALP